MSSTRTSSRKVFTLFFIMKRNVIFIAFLLGIRILFAQECNQQLSGKVIDFHDGNPLEAATITFNDQLIITNDSGNFEINGLCSTTYAFTVSHEDCNSRVFMVNINTTNQKNFYLEHHLDELEEVTISGTEKNIVSSSQEKKLNSDVIERYNGAALGDALREIVGVSSLNTGATLVKPVIQGLSGSRVMILQNGVRMQDMEWGDEHAPTVDINTADNITVVKGASALQYGGDAVGGIIIMNPKRVPVKDTLYGKSIFTGISNGRGGSLTSQIIKGYENGWFIKGQGSIKLLGDTETPDYILSNTGIFEKGASLAFGDNKFTHGWDFYYSFYNAKIGVLAASHIGNVNSLITSINSGQPDIINPFTYDIENPKQEVTHHLGKIKFFKRFEGLGKLTAQYDFQHNQRFEFDVRRTSALSRRPSIDLELTTHTLTADFGFDARDNYEIKAGVLLRYQNNFADARETGVRRLIPDYDKYDTGAFITTEYNLSELLVLDAGIRYDFTRIDAKKFYSNSRWEQRGYEADFSEIVIERNISGSQLLTNPVFDYHNISASGGIQYTTKTDSQLRFNYTLAQRAPNPAELFSDGLHHSAARIELGELRITQETSHKIAASFQKEKEHWGWEIAPYANFINNYILLEPTGAELTIRGAFPVWQYRKADVRLLGVDTKAFIQWNSNWITDHSFSLIKGIEAETKVPLINIPPASLENKLTFRKKEWFHLQTSLESQYTFRQNEFPPNIEVFSPNEDENITLEINTPPDAYHLLQFDMDMEFKLSEKNTVKTGLTINNLLNTTYRNYLNRQRYFADDLGRNFLLRLIINF